MSLQNSELRNLTDVLKENSLTAKDLVDISSDQLTFKQVQKVCKGKAITINIQNKIIRALNACLKEPCFKAEDFFKR